MSEESMSHREKIMAIRSAILISSFTGFSMSEISEMSTDEIEKYITVLKMSQHYANN